MDSGGGAGGAAPPAADERRADCVYYLASPLTCTKGSECEYRHSDAARANPRDCWYWFNGNCANPKCSFRHPPLDDMLGAPATPRVSQPSAPQVPAQAQAPAGGAAKPGVPCYYFQKGMCAKGTLCAFSHAPQFGGNPALNQTVKGFAPALQPHLLSKNPNSWVKPANSAQQNTAPAVHEELKVSAHNGKPAQKQNPMSRAYHSSGIYQNHSNSYVLSGTAKSYQTQPSVEDDTAETGEFVREPSAGSSVVAGSVDDDAERSFKEVQNSYRRTSGEQNTRMHRQGHGGYELERSHRSSSDRLMPERRLSSREPVPVTANTSDLRHRLLKQRRLNDPRSTQVSDRQDRRHPEDERHSSHRRREEERATHDSLSRSRLHGRIKLPGETSLDRPGPYPEKERRPRDRLSPPKQTDLRAKIHDRLKVRSNEDIPGNVVKSSVVKASSGEDAGVVNFSGPKSLAELRAKKVAANSSVEHITKNADRTERPARMTSEIITNRVSPDPVPFDGPKPLSVILKRKREAASADAGSVPEEPIAEEEEQSLTDSILEGRVEVNTEDNEEEEAFHPEDEVMYDESLSPADDNAAEAAADTGKEELEEGEQQEDLETAEEEYEYEAADNVNAEEDNDYQEYEDDDDLEDDDDFARKVGVLIS